MNRIIPRVLGLVALISQFANGSPSPPGLVGGPSALVERDEGIGMKWTGRIFPDQEPTVLWGDAESIYNQIISINPNYDPDQSVTASDYAELGIPDPGKSLQKRATVTCATMATGSRGTLEAAAQWLNNLGGICAAPGYQCRRMTCHETSATYFCSELSVETGLPCSNAAGVIQEIYSNCCHGSGKGLSGHYYIPARWWSIWIGYGNCNHSPNTYPHTYGYPGGSPNGLCNP